MLIFGGVLHVFIFVDIVGLKSHPGHHLYSLDLFLGQVGDILLVKKDSWATVFVLRDSVWKFVKLAMLHEG